MHGGLDSQARDGRGDRGAAGPRTEEGVGVCLNARVRARVTAVSGAFFLLGAFFIDQPELKATVQERRD